MPETLYKCCSPECPGLTWRASDYPHPCKGEPHARATETMIDFVSGGGYAFLDALCMPVDRGEHVGVEHVGVEHVEGES